MTNENNDTPNMKALTKYDPSTLSKSKVKSLLDEIRKGNTLLCKKGQAGKFDKNLTLLLLLVGTKNGDMITVPYYDVKKVNLWQDFFMWYGKSVLELDFTQADHIKEFYMFTKNARAQGYPLYLSSYSGYAKLVDAKKNKTSFYFPEQISSTDIIKIKAMGTVYPALDQVHDTYNNLMTKPRFNVVEAIINWYKTTGQWLDPNWLEQQSKEWTIPSNKEQYVIHRELLMQAEYCFDDPRFTEQFTFVKEPEKVSDLATE